MAELEGGAGARPEDDPKPGEEHPAEHPTEHPTEPHEHGRSLYEPEEFLDAPEMEEIPEREVSLSRRFLNVRTIGSIVFGLALLAFLFVFVLKLDWGKLWQQILGANPWFLLAALAAYYLTFPIRGARWAFVLRRSGTRIGLRPATEILFLSWFVNCLVPAKLGDLYRAWLLKGNFGGSASRTVGTVFIERIADIIVIFGLALAAGFWSFRGRNKPEIDTLFLVGFAIAFALVLFVVGLRFWGNRLTRFLPERVQELYARFHEGSTGALTVRAVPVILGFTGVIWLLEGARVYLVIRALSLPDAHLGISASVFVALAAALLTAIPLTPAGVGFVEAGIIGALLVYGVPHDAATAVALVDRAISIVTVIILGGIAYAFSGLVRRAHGGGVGPSRPPGAAPGTGA